MRGLSAILLVIALLIAPACLAAEKRPMVFGINRVGSSGPIFDPPGYDEQLYQRIREVGGTCVRLAASPRDIEPERGKRNWADFDRDLGLALKYGMEPMVCVVNTPAWASPTGEATHLYPYKTELLPEFADFCTDLAKRTKGKARIFQIWNEQNGCSWHFHDGFNHADEYCPVLRTAYKALKKGNPDCLVFMGSLDDAEGHAPIFTRKIYEERDKQFPGERIFDGITDHPYSDDPATMKKKLDAIREIMKAHGDGDLPIWITEYGWHTGNTSKEDQAKRTAEFLEAFCRPDWDFLKGAIQLSVADFEGGREGFGIVDSNLRPKPAFYAFQGVPRFGASPPYRIEWRPLAADRLEVTWKTILPTTGRVELAQAGAKSIRSKATTSGKDHRIELPKLKPGGAYILRITTTAEDKQSYVSAPYEVLVPGKGVYNGDFEQGFFAGIANGWRVDGEGFCTDMSLVPKSPSPIAKHAQAVLAYGEMGQKLNLTLTTFSGAKMGDETSVKVRWASEVRDSQAKVLARIGVDPTGGTDPGSSSVVWTDWQSPKSTWESHRLNVKAANTVMGIIIQCRSEGDLGKGMALLYLDDVQAES